MPPNEEDSVQPFPVVNGIFEEQRRNGEKKNVFIFDIDGTLTYHRESEEHIIGDHECPSMLVDNVTYVFKPHVKALFSYLLTHGGRIGFFSAGSVMRNHLLITNLMTQFYGHEGYTDLSNLKQFRIISRDMTVVTNGDRVKKDLTVLLEDNEALENVILIEDRTTFMHPGQDPCILVYESNGCNEYDTSYSDLSMKLFAKNTSYYLLGIFKQYFESGKYDQLSLRESIKLILSTDTTPYEPTRSMPIYPVQLELIRSGLQEVRKTVPEALFYGSVTNDMSRALSASAGFLCDEDFHHTHFEVQSILNDLSSGEKDQSDPHMEVFLANMYK